MKRIMLSAGGMAIAAGLGLAGLWGATSSSVAARESGQTAIAIVAGGCFWCVEADFDKVPGVKNTVSGYAGGRTKNPTYKSVTYGNTGHYEVVKITYDPKVVSYNQLLHYFWRTVDPTDAGGQFCDRGESYRTAVFPVNDKQKAIATESKAAAEKALGQAIVSKIIPLKADKFTRAEAYHQDYYKRNPIRYRYYRTGCRRDARIKQVWGKQAKQMLTN